MAAAQFRFYEELNDFLPAQRRRCDFDHDFVGRSSVKDMIEAIGVPHTEIDLILVNGRSVDFSYIVQDGDRISVYPVFESFDITPLLRLRPRPLRISRFVLDTHLGKLARYLRMLGFDALYRNDYDDQTLALLASAEPRILLTRDQGLLKRRIVTHGYYVRAVKPREQLEEVLARLDLYRSMRPFERCINCNGVLKPIPKEAISARLETNTLRYFQRFWSCEACERIYWEGSHYQHMQRLLQELLNRYGDAAPKT